MNESADSQKQEQKPEENLNESFPVDSDNVDAKPLVDEGIHELIVSKIRLAITSGRLISTDIDSRVCEQLRLFPNDPDSIKSLFDEFESSDLTGVNNKSSFLCSLIKQWKLRNPTQEKSVTENSSTAQLENGSNKHKPGPDEIKLKEILERTKYNLEITAGQRKYGGPPPDGPERPVSNSEIFIGKLPREVFEDELIPICEEAGKIWDLRLMIDPTSGFNKGYCFVTYCEPGDSQKAVQRLDGYAIRPGKTIKANISVANTRLFIGNIPKTKSKEEIELEITKIVEGVVNVIIYTPIDEADKKKNRGFCFVDFDAHKNASVAKRKLSQGRVRLFNRDIAVDWADPDEEPDDETMSQVKVLYVKNLSTEVTEADVRDLFLSYGSIERVRKVRDYAFIHFDKRDDALNAMNGLNGKELGRNTLEINLAKPLSEKRKQAQIKREQRKNQEFSTDSRAPTYHGPERTPSYEPPPTRQPAFQRSNTSFNAPDFGAFGPNESTNGSPTMRNNHGPINRNNRSGPNSNMGREINRYGGDRTGFPLNRPNQNTLNSNQRGNFHNNNQRGPPNNYNPGSFYNQGNPMNGRSQNSNSFGGFNGGTIGQSQNFSANNRNSNNFGVNQQFGGTKRNFNQMNNGPMQKRMRIDNGSWGAMTAGPTNNNNNNAHLPQSQNNAVNWYQEQNFNSSQNPANYSWS